MSLCPYNRLGQIQPPGTCMIGKNIPDKLNSANAISPTLKRLAYILILISTGPVSANSGLASNFLYCANLANFHKIYTQDTKIKKMDETLVQLNNTAAASLVEREQLEPLTKQIANQFILDVSQAYQDNAINAFFNQATSNCTLLMDQYGTQILSNKTRN